MLLQIAMDIVDLTGTAGEPLPRIPAGVEFSGREHRFRALRHRQLGVENRAPTFKCGSSASRAMNRRMISLEPSKIVFTRQSRRNLSTAIGGSPRPASESAVS